MTKIKKELRPKNGQNIKDNLSRGEKNDNIEPMESPSLCEVPSKCLFSIAMFLEQSSSYANLINEDGILENCHEHQMVEKM